MYLCTQTVLLVLLIDSMLFFFVKTLREISGLYELRR
jgi:hypothetical protein